MKLRRNKQTQTERLWFFVLLLSSIGVGIQEVAAMGDGGAQQQEERKARCDAASLKNNSMAALACNKKLLGLVVGLCTGVPILIIGIAIFVSRRRKRRRAQTEVELGVKTAVPPTTPGRSKFVIKFPTSKSGTAGDTGSLATADSRRREH